MGTTSESSNIYKIFKSVQEQLETIFKIDANSTEYKDYKQHQSKQEIEESKLNMDDQNKESKKREEFKNKLSYVSEKYLTVENRQLIIFLDSIDQLNDENHNLKWFFNKLPKNVKIVYSVLRDFKNIVENLKKKLTKEENIFEIKPITIEEGKNIYMIEEENQDLKKLGERVSNLRARRGMTRKAVAVSAKVSERHLANLEYGKGNASFLVLLQISEALQCSMAELIGDLTTSSPEWLMIRELLTNKDEATLRQLRILITEALMSSKSTHTSNHSRIALIGLRGAGKSTLGYMLAEDLGFQFVELSREIEKFAGCSISEIQGLYGMNAYRRYERRAIEETIQIYPEVVIATPGGIVSDTTSFNLVLAHCTTVWLQANPEDHMQRVVAQGDMRPMADSKEAMDDLKKILIGRAAFYSQAPLTINTSSADLEKTFMDLRNLVRKTINKY